MKSFARFLLVALSFATTGLFAEAAVEAVEHPAHGIQKIAKKTAKKHRRRHARRTH